MRSRLYILSAAICLFLTGCDLGTLQVERPTPRPAPTEPENPLFDPSVDCSSPRVDPGPHYVRRLTNEEYVNTVGDVLGVDIADLRARLPGDSYVAGFKNTAIGLSVSGRRIEQYAHIAGEVAERLDPDALGERASCTLGDSACERAFLRDLGLQLFRRPMTDAEVERFARLFRVVESEGDGFERAARLVVEAMVQSPQFLYRLEARHPEARLPRRTFDASQFEHSADGARTKKLDLQPGRYRISVDAALAPGAKAASLSLDFGSRQVERWPVEAIVSSPYTAGFEVGEEQGGRQVVALTADGEVAIDGVELVGPFSSSLDLSGPDVTDGVRLVTGYVMASRLSYFIWHSAPDKVLLEAAAAGELQTADQIAAQAERMLEDRRARRALRSYLDEWLRLDFLDTIERDEAAFPEFSRALVEAMKAETYRLFEAIIWEERADLLSVFTAQKTWTTADLAKLYGFEPVEGEAEYDLSEIDERQGLLTHASILALTSTNESTSPVKRGLYVRTQFMCQPVAPPPGDASSDAPEVAPDASTRERLAQHTEDPNCAYCHKMMDPVGFGFEHYGPMGAFRTHEPNGAQVDASGRLETDDDPVEFYGAPELGQILHDSDAVETCMVQNVYQYAIGRPPGPADVCDLRAVRERFTDEGRTYGELVLGVVTSDAFRYTRTPATKEAP
ncbi:DUF1592 domain-containing protein [Persicimonas caeni]|uniref:DUF1592 domain-containing protein n=1 Tax=Persicimonas caeni TaxID=2292766 RepID=A0A4Y6PYC3_PERCE|nr:DUF1592 domain-containing protein [Persicimonas caeni]QDG53322.1 DUF1592 domain-containing protein [Persicimonas caeni]QED34543.1 DUF1592 domain-containing protein [Persicimonas caeni]